MTLEIGLTWAAIAVYLVASVGAWVALLWAKERWLRWVLAGVALGLAVHTVPLVARWARTGHGPYIASFEVLSASVWVALAIYLPLATRRVVLRWAAAPVLSVGIVMLGWGVMSNPEIVPLPPTFRSMWLVVHIIGVKLAFGSILVASGLAVVYLARARLGADAEARLAGTDELSYRLVAFGFVFIAFMVAAGAIWARDAWGSYWSWDPLETWSLVTWVAYGLALHARLTYKLRGRAWAIAVLALMALSLFALFVASLVLPTVHVQFMVS